MRPADVAAWHRAEAADYRQRAENARTAALRYPATAGYGAAVTAARYRGVALAGDLIADRHDAMAQAVEAVAAQPKVRA